MQFCVAPYVVRKGSYFSVHSKHSVHSVRYALCGRSSRPVPVQHTVEEFSPLRVHPVLLLISNVLHMRCTSVPPTVSVISMFTFLVDSLPQCNWRLLLEKFRQNFNGLSAIQAQNAITGIALYTDGGGESITRPGRFIPWKECLHPLYRRLVGPQNRSGQVQKISPPPGYDPRTVQHVASRYTDYARRPTSFRKGSVITMCSDLSNGIVIISSS